MKYLVVILAVALPLAVTAQQGNHESEGQAASVNDAAALVESLNNVVATDQTPADFRARGDSGSGYEADQSSHNNNPPSTTSSEPELSRPPISGSMVGYIDDAIVGSEIRIRFDDAFNNDNPDLAEFFYAKCGCYKMGTNSPGVDPNASGPAVGVPTRLNFQQLFFRAEYAPVRRFSFYIEVPFQWIQPQGFQSLSFSTVAPLPNQGGISDVQAGFKAAIVASRKQYLTFQLQGYFPSGNASKGLGTNHYSIQPELAYYQRLSERAAMEAEGGIWVPIGGSAGVPTVGSPSFAGNIFFYGVGPSYKVYNGERVQIAPVLELVGWHVLSGFWTDPADLTPGATLADIAETTGGINIVNLKAGVRTNFGRNSVYVGYGHTLTDVNWYQDIFRVEYRYAF